MASNIAGNRAQRLARKSSRAVLHTLGLRASPTPTCEDETLFPIRKSSLGRHDGVDSFVLGSVLAATDHEEDYEDLALHARDMPAGVGNTYRAECVSTYQAPQRERGNTLRKTAKKVLHSIMNLNEQFKTQDTGDRNDETTLRAFGMASSATARTISHPYDFRVISSGANMFMNTSNTTLQPNSINTTLNTVENITIVKPMTVVNHESSSSASSTRSVETVVVHAPLAPIEPVVTPPEPEVSEASLHTLESLIAPGLVSASTAPSPTTDPDTIVDLHDDIRTTAQEYLRVANENTGLAAQIEVLQEEVAVLRAANLRLVPDPRSRLVPALGRAPSIVNRRIMTAAARYASIYNITDDDQADTSSEEGGDLGTNASATVGGRGSRGGNGTAHIMSGPAVASMIAEVSSNSQGLGTSASEGPGNTNTTD